MKTTTTLQTINRVSGIWRKAEQMRDRPRFIPPAPKNAPAPLQTRKQALGRGLSALFTTSTK